MLPAIVEEMIDGNLAKVEISKNLSGFIGNSPPIYTSRSFGVPGIKNSKNKTVSTFFSSENHLLFSSLSIFSFETKLYIKFLPNLLTAKKIIKLLRNAPKNTTISPPIGP